MIYGNIQNWEREKWAYARPFQIAMNYIRNTDFSGLVNGQYEIEGDNIFAKLMEVETKEKNDARPETHEDYIDVQYLIAGEEIIGCAKMEAVGEITENCLKDRDVIFYRDVAGEIDLEMNPGNYAVFFPADVHRPACKRNQIQKIRKVVVKIKVDML